jgi:hypothetical protein
MSQSSDKLTPFEQWTVRLAATVPEKVLIAAYLSKAHVLNLTDTAMAEQVDAAAADVVKLAKHITAINEGKARLPKPPPEPLPDPQG